MKVKNNLCAEAQLEVIHKRIAEAREGTRNLCCNGLMDFLLSDVDDGYITTKKVGKGGEVNDTHNKRI